MMGLAYRILNRFWKSLDWDCLSITSGDRGQGATFAFISRLVSGKG